MPFKAYREPPSTDPQAGWCGEGRRKTSTLPDSLSKKSFFVCPMTKVRQRKPGMYEPLFPTYLPICLQPVPIHTDFEGSSKIGETY